MKKRYIVAGCLLLIAMPILLVRLDLLRAERLHLIPPLLLIFLAIAVSMSLVQRRKRKKTDLKKNKEKATP